MENSRENYRTLSDEQLAAAIDLLSARFEAIPREHFDDYEDNPWAEDARFRWIEMVMEELDAAEGERNARAMGAPELVELAADLGQIRYGRA